MTAAELRQRLRRVGIWMPPPERAGIDPAKTAAAIEGAGFTSVWVGGGNATPDALDRLRPLLAGSENLIVATGIANVWAWDPARLRAAAAALAADFPDRFILGLGVSHEPAVTALGHPYQRPLRKMEKFLDELDHPAEHGADGDLPPVVLAALGPKMLELSRAQTAGAHPYFTTPEHTAFARSVLGNEPLLVPEQAVSLVGDEAAGLAAGRAYAARYLRLPNYTRNLERFGFTPADFTDAGSERLISAVIPSGPQAALDTVRAHLEAGADHVVIQPLDDGGGFAPAALGDLASVVTELMELGFPERARGVSPGRVPHPGHVVQVMDRVVNEITAERLDGEHRAVTAPPGPAPLVAADGREPAGQGVRGGAKLPRDLRRVLLAVPVGDRGLVLVPVRVDRVVLGQHQPEAVVVQPEHVPDVAAVLERRPLAGQRPPRGGRRGQRFLPGGGVRPHHRGDVCPGDRAGVEAALGTRAAQHPRPVLGVRNDRHIGLRYSPPSRGRSL
jgi:probable F420-dependent oxidoreductase